MAQSSERTPRGAERGPRWLGVFAQDCIRALRALSSGPTQSLARSQGSVETQKQGWEEAGRGQS